MMNLTTETILASTTYGTPSGNYDGSSLDFFGNVARAVNYYAGQGSIQTVTIQVTDFTGTIKLQTSLNDNPESAHWFDVYEYNNTIGTITDYHPVTLTGNYVWIRAEIVGFESGTINGITITY